MTRSHYLTAAAVFLVAFCVYVATMAPSVAFIDSGPLTVAAWSGGNAHPPGFPLYLVLTRLVTLIPVNTVAWRANLASGLFAAGACAVVALCAGEAVLRFPSSAKTKRAAAQTSRRVLLAMILTGTSLLFSRTLWRYGTVAEVYALNTVLIAAILWLVLRWRRTRQARDLFLAAALFGLALGVHHVTVGLTFFGIAGFMVITAGVRFLFAREVFIAGVLAIATTVAVYAYLPIAASRKPPLNWGNPVNGKSIWQHVSGAQYQSFIKGSRTGEQAAFITKVIAREFGPRRFPAVLLLAVAGLVAMAYRDRALLTLTVVGVTGCSAWLMIYPIQNDRDAYLLPAIALLAMSAACGAAALAGKNPGLLVLFLLLPVVSAVAHWPYRDRSDWKLPRAHVENTLRPVKETALLITSAEGLYMPLFYYQEVEKLRPDVRAINWELLQRWWYVETMEQKYPDVFEPVRAQLDAFRPSLILLRDEPEKYAIASVRQEINDRYDDLLIGMIREQVQRGVNVYLTNELAFSRKALDQNFVRRLNAEWQLVPLGIPIAILPRSSPPPDADIPMDLQELISPTVRYEDDDVVKQELIPTYRHALVLRARHLTLIGNREGAARDFRDAAILER